MSDDFQEKILEAIHGTGPAGIDRGLTEFSFIAGLAAAVRLLREPTELPEGWRATRWRGPGGAIERLSFANQEYTAYTYVGTVKQIIARYPTLAEAIAAVEAARSSGR